MIIVYSTRHKILLLYRLVNFLIHVSYHHEEDEIHKKLAGGVGDPEYASARDFIVFVLDLLGLELLVVLVNFEELDGHRYNTANVYR